MAKTSFSDSKPLLDLHKKVSMWTAHVSFVEKIKKNMKEWICGIKQKSLKVELCNLYFSIKDLKFEI